MNPKKVLVINEGYSDNLGDQAINESLQYLLRQNSIKNIDFQDFTKKIDMPLEISIYNTEKLKQKTKNVLSIKTMLSPKLRWIIKQICRVIKVSKNKYDLVVIGGGQLILSNDSFSIAMFSWVFLLKLFGTKNIVLFGVGSGTKFTFIDKLLFKYVLKNVSSIYVRDYKSQKTLKELFSVDTKFVYDVAFVHNKIQNIEKINKNNILLGVISFDVYNRYNYEKLTKEEFFETWVEILNQNDVHLRDVDLFYTTKDDRNSSLEFKKYVSNKYDIELNLMETNTKDKLIMELVKSKIVISARMHALILGLTYNCKILTYPISDKLKEFDNMFGRDFNLSEMQNDVEVKIGEVIVD